MCPSYEQLSNAYILQGLPTPLLGVGLRAADGQGERPGHRPGEGGKNAAEQVQSSHFTPIFTPIYCVSRKCDPFYVVTSYIKWVTTSWTHRM